MARSTMYEDIDEEIAKHVGAKYSDEKCPICGSRIDENGLCACGAAS